MKQIITPFPKVHNLLLDASWLLVTSGRNLLAKDIYSSKKWHERWLTPGKPFSAAAVVVVTLVLGLILARATTAWVAFAWGPLRRKFCNDVFARFESELKEYE